MTMRAGPSELAQIFDAEVRDPGAFEELGPRYNVAPTQPVTVVVQRDEGRLIELHRWGLVPSWADSVAVGARMINARAETLATSAAFRPSLMRWRCVIPADGFYEWRRDGKARKPFLIHAADDRPLAFAGLWAPWRDPSTGFVAALRVRRDHRRERHRGRAAQPDAGHPRAGRMAALAGPDDQRPRTARRPAPPRPGRPASPGRGVAAGEQRQQRGAGAAGATAELGAAEPAELALSLLRARGRGRRSRRA